MPKSPECEILRFEKLLYFMCAIQLECIYDLIVICAQSWGQIDALRNFRSYRTSPTSNPDVECQKCQNVKCIMIQIGNLDLVRTPH